MLVGRAFLNRSSFVSIAGVARGQPVDPYQQPPPPSAPAPAAPAPARTPAQTPAAPATPRPTAPAPAAPGGETPLDPYATPGRRCPGSTDVGARGAALVVRAQELLDARSFLDAKQLAVEALVGRPAGRFPASRRARSSTPSTSSRDPGGHAQARGQAPGDVDTTPIRDPTLPTEPAGGTAGGRLAQRADRRARDGGLYGGLLGATVGAFFSSDSPAKGARPGRSGRRGRRGVRGARLIDRLALGEAQVRMNRVRDHLGRHDRRPVRDIAKTRAPRRARCWSLRASPRRWQASVAYAVTRTQKLTRGDIALIDTLAGIGAVAASRSAMVMQPVETEPTR